MLDVFSLFEFELFYQEELFALYIIENYFRSSFAWKR